MRFVIFLKQIFEKKLKWNIFSHYFTFTKNILNLILSMTWASATWQKLSNKSKKKIYLLINVQWVKVRGYCSFY